VLRYLKGTLDFGLNYNGDHDFRLSGYTDSDWVGSVSDKKYHFRILFQYEFSHDFVAE
jgi:hypothetical protein